MRIRFYKRLVHNAMRTKVLIVLCTCGLMPYIFMYYISINYVKIENIKVMKAIHDSAKDARYAEVHRKFRIMRNTIKYILLWVYEGDELLQNLEEGQKYFIDKNCPIIDCFVTKNKNMLNDDITQFDAVIFSGCCINRLDVSKLPQKRSQKQKYVFINMKTPDDCQLCNPIFNNFFNWTLSYRLDSDIPAPFIKIIYKNSTIVGPRTNMTWVNNPIKNINHDIENQWKKKSLAAAWIMAYGYRTDDVRVYGLKLTKALQEYNLRLDDIHAHRHKTCLLHSIKSTNCSEIVQNKYYFYYAYERSMDNDFVTKNILRALNNYAIPIVYGGANYSRFLPVGSYLDATKFTPAQMAAEILKIIHSNNTYKKYFDWRKVYSYQKASKDEYLCKLCASLHNKNMFSKKDTYADMRHWWNPKYKEECSEKISEEYKKIMQSVPTPPGSWLVIALGPIMLLKCCIILYAYTYFKRFRKINVNYGAVDSDVTDDEDDTSSAVDYVDDSQSDEDEDTEDNDDYDDKV